MDPGPPARLAARRPPASASGTFARRQRTIDAAAAGPHPLTFVDGAEGIARRVTVLTKGQAWPEAAPEGIAVFTSDADVGALMPTLARYGLSRIERL